MSLLERAQDALRKVTIPDWGKVSLEFKDGQVTVVRIETVENLTVERRERQYGNRF